MTDTAYETEDQGIKHGAAPPDDDGHGQTDPMAGSGPAARLSTRQFALLTAMQSTPSMHLACEAAGVSRATGFRWAKQPTFQAELTRQRDQTLTNALATIKNHAERAVTQLAGLLDAKDERIRRLVCNDIIAHALKMREQEEIEQRLAALEKAMAKTQTRRKA